MRAKEGVSALCVCVRGCVGVVSSIYAYFRLKINRFTNY